MKFLLPSLFLSAAILTCSAFAAAAFELRPVSREFAPAGSGATQSYEIVNDGDKPLAVELSMLERQSDINGAETYSNADDDFLIYPSQILLNPGETQSVRVTWLGDPQPNVELAYRLLAEQLPINLDQAEDHQATPIGDVQVLLRYLGSVYIHPANTEANVVLETIESQTDTSQPPGLVLTFNNQGNARAVLRNFHLNLVLPTGETVSLPPEQLSTINNFTILAGHRRRFVIPYPNDISVTPTTATFTFDPE
jgi:fimbrial chaperone protein